MIKSWKKLERVRGLKGFRSIRESYMKVEEQLKRINISSRVRKELESYRRMLGCI